MELKRILYFVFAVECKTVLRSKLMIQPRYERGIHVKLKTSALLAITGLLYIFVSRSIGTYWPEIFYNINITRINAILSLLALLTILLFYYSLFNRYAVPGKSIIKEESGPLKKATIAAITGTLLLIPLLIKGIALTYGKMDFPFSEAPKPLILYLMLGSALCALYFAMIFYSETSGKVSARLTSAAKLAIIGCAIILLIRTYLFFNFYYASQFKWSGELTREMPYALIPMLLFIFYTAFNFLLAFYREINSE